jgi:large subunit ribosomal protein L4
MELKVVNIKGEDTGRVVSLSDEIFAIEPNDHAIYLDVKQYLANQRQGTHKSKERADISGSTRKIKRQKGTGTARAGSIKSPLFRGGGRIFGPRPKDYHFKLNKKLKSLARKSVWSYKAAENKITVLEDFNFDAPKTKEFIKILKGLELEGTKVLLVMPETKLNVSLSARNLEKVKLLNTNNLNSYDLLNASRILLVESSIPSIDEIFKNN